MRGGNTFIDNQVGFKTVILLSDEMYFQAVDSVSRFMRWSFMLLIT